MKKYCIALLFFSHASYAMEVTYKERVARIVAMFDKIHQSLKLVKPVVPEENNHHAQMTNVVRLELSNPQSLFQELEAIETFDWANGKREDATAGMKQAYMHCAKLHLANQCFDIEQEEADETGITILLKNHVPFSQLEHVFGKIPLVTRVVNNSRS